jgi:hypothetical protein
MKILHLPHTYTGVFFTQYRPTNGFQSFVDSQGKALSAAHYTF